MKREAEERADAANGGGEQIATLQKAKRELENKLREQVGLSASARHRIRRN